MKSLLAISVLSLLVLAATLLAFGAHSQTPPSEAKQVRTYLGFDRNGYPGDEAMKLLRKDFTFTGYWLSPPPGEKTNSWQGKREYLRSLGYGFLPLYRARESTELKSEEQAQKLGEEDARSTIEAAQRDGFPDGSQIFLDIEEGGRLSPIYHAYIRGWLWRVAPIPYRGGFYCSGMPVREGRGVTITTADDIYKDLWRRSREFAVWVYNDACPPSPGCSFNADPPVPSNSGIDIPNVATVWQFAQSPRRKQFTARCPAKYASDGNCYAPTDTAHKWFLDLNSATSPDPSTAQRWPQPK